MISRVSPPVDRAHSPAATTWQRKAAAPMPELDVAAVVAR